MIPALLFCAFLPLSAQSFPDRAPSPRPAIEAKDRTDHTVELSEWPNARLHLEVDHLLGTVTYRTGAADRIEIALVRIGHGRDQAAADRHMRTIRLEVGTNPEDVDKARNRSLWIRTLAWDFPDCERAWPYIDRGDAPAEAHLFITAPPRVATEIETHYGTITLQGVRGHITAVTTRGQIDVQGASGSLELVTTDGPIWLRGATDVRVMAHTLDGHIHATEFQGDVDAHTYSGAIDIEYRNLGTGHQYLFTEYGNISLTLPAVAPLRLDIHAPYRNFDSRIRFANVQRSSDRFRGDLGHPNTPFDIRTRYGQVRVIQK